MFRILHLNYFYRLSPGYTNQLIAEVEAAQELLAEGIEWQTRVFTYSDSREQFIHRVPKAGRWPWSHYRTVRAAALDWLIKNQNQYDAVLIRYAPCDLLLHRLPRLKPRLYTVHHTREGDELAWQYGLKGRVGRLVDNHIFRHLSHHLSGLVSLTPEIERYETARGGSRLDGFCFPNGIGFKSEPESVSDRRAGAPKMMLIASDAAAWHGIDRIAESLQRSTQPCELHLVGDIPQLLTDDDRVFYHGRLNRHQIAQLSASIDLGLAPFALDRKNMSESCSLKVREYLSLGIPVYGGSPDSGLPSDFPYYQHGGFDLEQALKMAMELRQVPREKVIHSARPWIDKKELMGRLAKALQSHQPSTNKGAI